MKPKGIKRSIFFITVTCIAICFGCTSAYVTIADKNKGSDPSITGYNATHSDYPAITWEGPGIITPDQVWRVQNAKKIATLGVRDALSGHKYAFVEQFTEAYEGKVLIHWIFVYIGDDRPFLFRKTNPDGRRYSKYILITTWPYKGDGCSHKVDKWGESLDSVRRYVYRKPDTLLPKSEQPKIPDTNKCR